MCEAIWACHLHEKGVTLHGKWFHYRANRSPYSVRSHQLLQDSKMLALAPQQRNNQNGGE